MLVLLVTDDDDDRMKKVRLDCRYSGWAIRLNLKKYKLKLKKRLET